MGEYTERNGTKHTSYTDGGGVTRSFESRWAPVAESPRAYGEGRAYGMQGRTVGEIVQESRTRDYIKRKYSR